MSAISGTGYGSSHNWQTAEAGANTVYFCEDCKASFVRVPEAADVFQAIKEAGVPDDCFAKAEKLPLTSEQRIDRLEQAVRDLYQLDTRFKAASFSKSPDSALIALQNILSEGDKE